MNELHEKTRVQQKQIIDDQSLQIKILQSEIKKMKEERKIHIKEKNTLKKKNKKLKEEVQNITKSLEDLRSQKQLNKVKHLGPGSRKQLKKQTKKRIKNTVETNKAKAHIVSKTS